MKAICLQVLGRPKALSASAGRSTAIRAVPLQCCLLNLDTHVGKQVQFLHFCVVCSVLQKSTAWTFIWFICTRAQLSLYSWFVLSYMPFLSISFLLNGEILAEEYQWKRGLGKSPWTERGIKITWLPREAESVNCVSVFFLQSLGVKLIFYWWLNCFVRDFLFYSLSKKCYLFMGASK